MNDEPVPPPEAEHLSVLLDVDGVLYPLPELFTPFAAERLGRELELDTTNWEFYTESLAVPDGVVEGTATARVWLPGYVNPFGYRTTELTIPVQISPAD